ncbi:hypothetical protein [Sphingomonas sp.]|uniref:hypothetical protein n=1 Tax=Sphingomonas sp. TaxID=28214 RepID=UPI003AFF6A04
MASSSRPSLRPAAFASASLLVGDRPIPVVLTRVDGTGACVASDTRLPLGAEVTLRHVDAGMIPAEVTAIEPAGLRLRFERGEHAMGFALAVLAGGVHARRRDAA